MPLAIQPRCSVFTATVSLILTGWEKKSCATAKARSITDVINPMSTAVEESHLGRGTVHLHSHAFHIRVIQGGPHINDRNDTVRHLSRRCKINQSCIDLLFDLAGHLKKTYLTLVYCTDQLALQHPQNSFEVMPAF